MTRQYSDCIHCGRQVEEELIDREIWWQGNLKLIQDVPVGVCRQCGQKTIHAEVARIIDRILSGTDPPDEFVQVPSYRFPDAEHVA